ncbi:MAG: 16S rRNA (uracil(1498)-N(3))-methyltransferase, partial [Pseudomonadota bacterium]
SSGAALQLPPDQAQHLVRVLRLQAGAAIRLFNGQGGEFDASIGSIARNAVTVQIGAHHSIDRESPLQVTLLQGIARGEKMDLILQKATELGVTAVVPVTTLRSTVRLDAETTARKHAHWQGVLAGACEQSGRNTIPSLGSAIALESAVAGNSSQLKLVLEPGDASSLKTLLSAAFHARMQNPTICILVGPEGGLDEREIQTAKLAGFQSCQLGPRVLRTETAALAALAALQSLAGDL